MLTENFKKELKQIFPDYEQYYKIIEYKNNRNIIVEDKYGLLRCYKTNLRKKCIPTIQASLDRQKYFLQYLKDKNEYYREGMFEVVSDYINNYTAVFVKDKYGICKLTPVNMLRNACPTIEAAVDKTKYFLKKLELDRYCVFSKWDFTNFKYVDSDFKSEVVCKTHGIFKCRPNHLLFGRAGCKKCANIKVGENATGWTLTNWINSSKTSKHFDSFKVYIIRCWDENEEFYKIGRTFRKLKERFGANSSDKMPYNWEVVKIIEELKDAEYVYKLESKLKRSNKVEKYRPIKQFRGMEECFKNVEYGM